MSSKITIKKKSNGNEYLLTEQGVWVRNFCKPNVPPLDINGLMAEEDYGLVLANELENRKSKYPVMDIGSGARRKCVVVSDGHDFSNKQAVLSKLPADVSVLAVNKALAKWKLVGDLPESQKKAIAFYVANNPYQEATTFLPKETKYFPKCVASVRTSPAFLKLYRGNIYSYNPVVNENYSGVLNDGGMSIDDYRNPVCAALSMATQLGVQKIMLFCCDDSFSQERAGAVHLENGLWSYPQQQISHGIIDAQLYWMSQVGIKVGDHSGGPKFKNAGYIKEDEVLSFFD